MRKVIKVFCAFCAVIALLSLSVFSVTAASSQLYFNSENFELYSCQVSRDGGSSWVSPSSYSFTTLSNSWGNLDVSYPNSNMYPLLSVRFDPKISHGSFSVAPYMQLNCNLQYFNVFGNEQYSTQTLSGALYLVSPDGIIYQFPLVRQEVSDDKSFSLVVIGGTVEVGEGFDLADCYIELRLSGITNIGGLQIKFQMLNLASVDHITDETAKIVESIDKGFKDLQTQQNNNKQEIIDNNNANTDKITDSIEDSTDSITGSIEDSTDKIVNGWESDNDSSDLDDFSDSLNDAESDALGGKSDEEIQEEVEDVLGGVSFPETTPENIVVVGDLFDDLLDVFGIDYQSLLVLSLTLGLGAFIVGRQFQAKE